MSLRACVLILHPGDKLPLSPLCPDLGKLKLQPLKFQNKCKMDSQVIIEINHLLKRTFNPIPEMPWMFKGSALIGRSFSRRANSLQKTHIFFLLAALLLKAMTLLITLEGKHGYTVCIRANLTNTELFPLSPALWCCHKVIQMWQRYLSLIMRSD